MKALRYYSRGVVRAEEVPIPEIDEDEVLVKTEACGICSSDILDWYREPKAPSFFGHEAVGKVTRVGRKVSGFTVGERVFVHHHVPCMVCRYCKKGDYSMCDAFRKSSIDPGGFAEYIRVPGENVRKGLIRIPEVLSTIEATFIEPLACCIQAVQRASLRIGERVAIFGAGFNGLLLAILSREFGAASVVVVEPNTHRREIAWSLGVVDRVFDASEEALRLLKREWGLADVVFVTPPLPSVINNAVEVADKGGTILIYAPSPPGSKLSVDIFHLYFSHLTVKTSYSASPLDTRLALSLLLRRRGVFQQIPVVQYPFLEFEKAFRDFREDSRIIKAVLCFGEEESLLHGEAAAWH